MNFSVDDLLIIQDKHQIDELMNLYLFFKSMSKKDIKKWADTCMEYVYKDLGYTKEQVLHATVHMDEKTSQLHCVVVPLIKKYDKRQILKNILFLKSIILSLEPI